MTAGSYTTSTFSDDVADEIRRLGVQVDLFWEEEKHVYDNFSIPSGGRILEIGSGPGFYIKKLASIFPEQSFTSFEYDQTFADYQPELFDSELASRVEIVQGDINTIEGLGEFDLVISRMVLEHLPEQEKIFDKMGSFVKDGGKFLLLDNDFSNHLRTYPRVNELDDLYQAYCNLRIDEGGNPYIGRELPRFFSLANYSDIHFRTITAHTYKTDKSIFLGAESSAIGMTLVKQGYLDPAVFKKLIINWSKMAHDSENVMTRELYCAFGTKNQDSVNITHHRQGMEAVAPLKEKKPTSISSDQQLISPQTETEKQIALVWEEHLGLDEVGTNISFFDTGGESYLIPLIVESLSDRFKIEVEITDLFEFPTIADLASFIDSRDQDATPDSVISSAELQRNATGKDSKQNPFARLKRKK